MSMSPSDPLRPSDPFEAPRDDQGFPQSPPPRKSRTGCLIGCGIAGTLGLVLCCGGGVLMTQFGLSMLADEFKSQLAGNPVIVEHVGDIESFDPDWSATIREAQNSGEKGDEAGFAFDIKGSKGSATVIVQQDKSGDGTGIQSATLVLPDGTRIPIEVSKGPSAVPDLGVDLGDLIDTGDADTGDAGTGDAGTGDAGTGDMKTPKPGEVPQD